MPERLRRLEHRFQRVPIYFITACTAERRAFLADDNVHAGLIQFAKEGERHGVWLGSYILMPDHLHLFVVVDDERLKLSLWVKSLKNTLSKILRTHGVSAPHWQKGFFDHVLRSGDSYSKKWNHVRENPMRAGVVRDWSKWPFLEQIFDLEFRNDSL